MIEGIIFDKDGVIFDMEPLYAQISINVLARYGITLTKEEYYDFWTRRGGKLKDFLKMRGITLDIEKINEERAEILNVHLKQKVPIIKGAQKTLEILSKRYPLSLVTSSYRKGTEQALVTSGFKHYFKHVIAIEDVLRGKPDPEAFLLASKQLGISPEKLVVIEDAEKGIIAAHAAGMKSIAIPHELTQDNDFSLASRIIKTIEEITPELILSLEEE